MGNDDGACGIQGCAECVSDVREGPGNSIGMAGQCPQIRSSPGVLDLDGGTQGFLIYTVSPARS